MTTSDPSDDAATSAPAPGEPSAAPTHMDVQTSQQMLREVAALTSVMFDLLQPHRVSQPELQLPLQAELQAEPRRTAAEDAPPPAAAAAAAPAPPAPARSIPLPDLPVPTAEAPEPPAAPSPLASIPVPSIPVPDLPSPEPEPEAEVAQPEPEPEPGTAEEDQRRSSRRSMALMNEIAFLDE